MSSERREQPLSGTAVLVVDDDDDVREMITTVLRMAGAKVLGASGTARARAVLHVETVDAVLLDWHLADGDCGDLLEELSAGEPVAPARTAVITGDLLESTGDEIRGRPVLIKPFRPAQLISFVERLLAEPAPPR